jgi:hypothetical protein
MRAKLAAIIGAVALASTIGGTSLAQASSRPAVSGTEHILAISTSSANSSKYSVIMTGAFTAGGTVVTHGSSAVITLPGGTFKVSAKAGKQTRNFSKTTCLFTVTVRGTDTLGHGTGKYAGISGSGRSAFSLRAVFPRVAGKCTMKRPPLALQEILTSAGSVSLH